jgi:hypothetical protein
VRRVDLPRLDHSLDVQVLSVGLGTQDGIEEFARRARILLTTSLDPLREGVFVDASEPRGDPAGVPAAQGRADLLDQRGGDRARRPWAAGARDRNCQKFGLRV